MSDNINEVLKSLPKSFSILFSCFILFCAFQGFLTFENHVFINNFLLRRRKGDIGNRKSEETRTSFIKDDGILSCQFPINRG